MSRARSVWFCRGLVGVSLLAAGCVQEMAEQPRYDPLEPSAFFADGQSARQPVAGTVPRSGPERRWQVFPAGPAPASPSPPAGGPSQDAFPMRVTSAVLERGAERYRIFCSPCHGPLGEADGPVVQRGYPEPPSLTGAAARSASPAQIVQIIADGRGQMPSYAAQVRPADRWAITAFLRALQVSREQQIPVEEAGGRLGQADPAADGAGEVRDLPLEVPAEWNSGRGGGQAQ